MKEIKQINTIKEAKGKQEEKFDYYETVNDDGSVTTGIKENHWQYREIEKEKKENKELKIKQETRASEELGINKEE